MHHWSSPPMWSMGSANRDDELKTMSYYYAPGPGTYDQVHDGTYKNENPAWKQGSSVRPPLYSSSNPGIGPGSYETKEAIGKIETNKEGKVQASFPKAKRGQSENKGVTTVGPGSYNPKKFAKAYPQFSFGYKGEGIYSNIRAGTPGPGAYEFKDPFEIMGEEAKKPVNEKTAFLRTAPQAFSQPKESAFGDHSTPGPGQNYNPGVDNYSFRYFAPTYSFGTSTRDDLYNSEAKNFPGPGKYGHAGGIKTKGGFTILGRHPSKGNASDTPAPNVYNQSINPLRKTAPSFRIGQAERKNLAMGSADVPGPGQYERPNQLSSKGARIGTSTRPPLYDSQKNPGPGQYLIVGETGNTFKYSMGVKPHPKKVSEVMPGPGEYDPFESATMERNNGAIIGTSERPPLYKKAGAPGPGQYDVRGNIGGGHRAKIGKARRAPLAKVNDEPGPGFYNIPSAIGNVPSYLKPGFAQERRKAAADKEVSFRGIFG